MLRLINADDIFGNFLGSGASDSNDFALVREIKLSGDIWRKVIGNFTEILTLKCRQTIKTR